MNQRLLSYLENVILVEVTGKNINRFLIIIYKMPIAILELKIINRKKVHIKIFAKDYERLTKIKTVNEIKIIDYYGKLKLKKLFKRNKIFFISLIFGYLLLLMLANLIFKIEVIHEKKEIRELIVNELKDNNIKKLRFKPKYDKLEEIEEDIIKKNTNRIEWLEIIEVGTKYIVKVEERRIIKEKKEYIYQDIIAAKDAVLMVIEAEQGVITKKKNDYVKKGDIIISGKIMHNNKIMDIVQAQGRIWGEVWYNVRVELPLIRTEEKITGLNKSIYSLKMLNFRLPLFDLKPYNKKQIEERVIINHQLIPFQLVKEKHYQVEKMDYIYNETEALLQAQELASQKILTNLQAEERILNSKPLKYYLENEILYLEMFFKVYEDITATKKISLIEEE